MKKVKKINKAEKQMILLLFALTVIAVIVICVVVIVNRGEEPANEGTQAQVQDQSQGKETTQVAEKYVQTLSEGTKLNTSAKLSETKTVDGLEVSNIELTMSDGQTLFLANVKNNTGADMGVKAVDIILVDDEGNEITTLHGVMDSVKAGETVQLNAKTTLDFSNAYDAQIVIK